MRQKRNTVLDISGVYKVNCNECAIEYIGQTGRSIKARIKIARILLEVR